MSHDSDNDINLDYASGGASVLDVHDAVRREQTEPDSGQEPVSVGSLMLAAGIVLLGAVYFGWHSENFNMESIYKTASYTPEPAPISAGSVIVEDTRPWIDQWVAAGKKNYANCIACHQPTGTGAPGQFPPLVGADYVTGGTERLAGILLHGINGPLTVNGASYNQQMPAWAILGDEKIAQILTYVRAEFGALPQQEAVVTTAMMKAAREKFSDRNTFWTEAELNQLSPEANLPGAEVDLLTGKLLGADGGEAAPAPAVTE